MNRRACVSLPALAISAAFLACARPVLPPVDVGSVAPGTSIARQGVPVRLIGTPIAVGTPLPATALVDAATMKQVDLARERGKVLFLSVIVSIDTGV